MAGLGGKSALWRKANRCGVSPPPGPRGRTHSDSCGSKSPPVGRSTERREEPGDAHVDGRQQHRGYRLDEFGGPTDISPDEIGCGGETR
jgi:hypothetical protein